MLLDPSDWSLASHADAVMAQTDRRAREPHEHRDTRFGARAANRPARRPSRRDWPSSRTCAGSWRGSSPPLGLKAAVARDCTRSRCGRTLASPRATATASCTGRCGSLPGVSRRSPCTCTWRCPTPKARCSPLNRLRSHLPLLLALSANSPFWQGRETGLASARTPLFQAFPRVGIPRAFTRLRGLRRTIDLLLRCEAFPEPTFLWWDVRLQPRFGTIEVRIMDAQTTVADSAALTALVQCLVRLEADRGLGRGPRDRSAGGARREPLSGRPRRRRGEPDRRAPRDAARSVPDVLESVLSMCAAARRGPRLRGGAAVDEEPGCRRRGRCASSTWRAAQTSCSASSRRCPPCSEP